MGVFTFTTEKPKHSGYYFMIWEEGNSPEFLYINYSIIDGMNLGYRDFMTKMN